MPFGASISCVNFQEFSNALRFITEYKIRSVALCEPKLTNYLDDFLFIALSLLACNGS